MQFPKPSVAYCALIAGFLSTSCGLGVSAQTPNVAPRITQAIDERNLVLLPRNTHRLARLQFDLGSAPPDLPLDRMLLVLKRNPEQESALTKLLDDQQDKSSPRYHQWLSPVQFGQLFGPADSDVQTITAWLRLHGFSVAQVSRGRTVIEFSGTAAQVEDAFHTSMHKYSVNGEQHWANAADPQIPSALAPVVAGVLTLHNFLKAPQIRLAEHPLQAKVSLQTPRSGPSFTSTSNPPTHAIAPADFATIYNFNTGYQPNNGFLPRIGIVGRSNIDTDDVNDFNQHLPVNGLNAVPTPYVILNGPNPGDLGGADEAEAVFDTSWSGTLMENDLPTVLLVVSATTNTTDGVDLSELYIIDNDLTDVMTESFGDCEANDTAAQATAIASLAQQAAAQGITYIVSAGDSGAEGCDDPDTETLATGPISVNVLASSPYTIAAGGTEFNENGQDSNYWSSSNAAITAGSAISYIPEDVWNDSCSAAQCGLDNNILAGGGGSSVFFAKPSWQSGVAGIPGDGARDLPDISFSASSHDPYLFCLHRSCVPNAQGELSFYAAYGTSVAAPAFAGIMGLVDISAMSRQGQADYVLYKLAATNNLSQCNGSNTAGLPAASCTFNDVTVGNNAVPGESGYGSANESYQSGIGFDLATGLGSVNIMNLLKNWPSATFHATSTTILSVAPASITHGQPVNIDVQVASNSGTPTGAVSLLRTSPLYNYGTSIGAFPLSAGSSLSSVSTLPGGTYTLTAYYGGDGIFEPSSSSPSASITVNPEPSITTLSVLGSAGQGQTIQPFTSLPYGSFVYLRADVAGQSQNGVATGSATFSDSASSISGNPFALNSQGNAATPDGIFVLSVGSHNITAAYSGDASFNASQSATKSFTITPAPTTTAVTDSAAAQGLAVTATVGTTSGGNNPTGSVTFVLNGIATTVPVSGALIASPSTLSTSQITAQASATITYPGLANGQNYTVTASYGGDANYLASSGNLAVTLKPDFGIASTPSTLTVNPGSSASVTISITSVDGYNGTVAFTPSACSGLPAESSCSFTPASVAGAGGTTLMIATTAPHQVAALRQPGARANWSDLLAVALLCAVFLAGTSRQPRWGTLLLAILITFADIGCGSGSSTVPATSTPSTDPGTVPGSYVVMVTASSGGTTHSTLVSLTVN
ncbi:MAG: protease pro-enzyme activation domain-containing protein [Candidatus Acidiferrales bacterium]